ncbi:MAG: hypothetical protein AAB768_02765 [Patescibacteria group bacterium]
MSEFGESPISYEEIKPELGPRTIDLLETDPQLKLCDPTRILAALIHGVSRAIVMLPGALDMKPDEDTFKLAKKEGLSAVMVRYPIKPAFSLRGEVAGMLDYLEGSGTSEVDLVTGSYGGIPALMMMYSAFGEGGPGVKFRSFFAAKSALQPSDLRSPLRKLAGASFALETVSKLPLSFIRGIRARVNAPNNEYPDESILKKIAEVPAMFIVPPGSGDFAVKITNTYNTYFPHAQVIEDSNARKDLLGFVTWGHMSPRSEPGLRILQESFLKEPNNRLEQLPDGYRRIK